MKSDDVIDWETFDTMSCGCVLGRARIVKTNEPWAKAIVRCEAAKSGECDNFDTVMELVEMDNTPVTFINDEPI